MTDSQPQKEAGERARSLRKTQTVSEGLLWGVLRARQLCGLNGQPVKTELVSITRGDRRVVRVICESVGVLSDLGDTSSQALEPGFISLFDGKTLNGWQGKTAAYSVENGTLIAEQRNANLFTTQQFSDFTLQFEFRLTPGANNGVAIRSPLSGNPAYGGFEIQILEAPYYDTPDYRRHGSIWGVVAAKPARLTLAGQWNYQEIRCVGPLVQVELNGVLILDVDLRTVDETADGKPHPGLTRESGHIGFMSSMPRAEFRNIRIKELDK